MFGDNTIVLAQLTKDAIETALQYDQGALYKKHLREILPTIRDAYETDQSGVRSHLGASIIGRDCSRQIYFNYRWSKKSKLDGKLIRLFNRGHLEEGRVIALLKSIGCDIRQSDENGIQYRISDVHGHFGGSCDGIIANGIPDFPNIPVILEIKTHNKDSFLKLQKDGVKSTKLEHYVQCCIYMYKFNIEKALYFAVNKDNDDIYLEVLNANNDFAQMYIARAGSIIFSPMPEGISKSISNFKCRICEYKDICHNDEPKAINCRTCIHSTPHGEGKWLCKNPVNQRFLSKEDQLLACNLYRPLNAA